MSSDIQSLLAALGDGATREHAEAALNWMATRPADRPALPARIGGIQEVADRVGQSRQLINNWLARGNKGLPAPIASIVATRLFDMDQIDQWCLEHPELVREPTNGDG